MKKFLALIVLVLVFTAVPAVAEMGHGRSGGWQGGDGPNAGMILRMQEKLNLSDEQVTQLEAIKAEYQDQMKESSTAVRDAHDVLRDAIEAGASAEELRAAAGIVGDAMGNNAVLRVELKSKIDGVLTAEQKAELDNLREARSERMEEMRGKGEKNRGDNKKGSNRRRGPRDPEEMFNRVDTNGDGQISAEEWADHADKMKAGLQDRQVKK